MGGGTCAVAGRRPRPLPPVAATSVAPVNRRAESGPAVADRLSPRPAMPLRLKTPGDIGLQFHRIIAGRLGGNSGQIKAHEELISGSVRVQPRCSGLFQELPDKFILFLQVRMRMAICEVES